MRFDEIIEAIDSMNAAEQDLLIEIIHKRRIEARREEILHNANRTFDAMNNGTAKKGSFEDLISDLED
jgi:hypothetical protein